MINNCFVEIQLKNLEVKGPMLAIQTHSACGALHSSALPGQYNVLPTLRASALALTYFSLPDVKALRLHACMHAIILFQRCMCYS